MSVCVRCKRKGRVEGHHITYSPPKKAPLCHRCHLLITEINTLAARKFSTDKKRKVKYTNVIRLALWYKFLEQV